MKSFLSFIFSLWTFALFSQVSFTENIDVPFQPVTGGNTEFADVDNDRDLDLLITGSIYYDIDVTDIASVSKLYINDGNGNFTENTSTSLMGIAGDSNAVFADIDNDDDPDLFLIGTTIFDYYYYEWSRDSKLYQNDGNGNFTEVEDAAFEGIYRSAVTFADIDNDGNGNFDIVEDSPFEAVNLGKVEFADVNNDDYLDVLITGRNQNAIIVSKLYRNDANGDFTEITDPALDGKVNLSYSTPKNTVLDISILDLSGKTLSEQTVIANTGENIFPLDLGSLNKGIYIIRLADGESTLPLKFVIK
ncbi:MAG: hypothetical protein ACI94Y_003757 [Maribacter sp.]|jgi:hypothetical protein